jgi:LysR family glycine cleavage system transcriptional activator
MTKLPPLNSLRAFEAAARHLSVTLAAEELFVTPGAVSRRIRLLEEELGVQLFLRGHQRIALTQEGAEYHKSVGRALQDMRDATSRLNLRTRKRELRIRAYTTFSMHWLIPRLLDFHTKYPDIELSLTTSLEEVDFNREDVDGAIRLGDGHWRGAHSHWLVPNRLCPVMSAQLPRDGAPLRHPNDLAKYLRLHSLARRDDWRSWLAAAGANEVEPHAGTTFHSSAMAYAAALQGQGIAMAQQFLVEPYLRVGHLVRPFDFTLDQGAYTYYLLTPSGREERPQMRAFRQWLLQSFSEASSTARPMLPMPAEI